jgi:glycosyltransferase involved in cell wall biosynthesis
MGKWTIEAGAALRSLGHDVTAWYADDLGRWCTNPRLAVPLGPVAAQIGLWRSGERWDVAMLHEPVGWMAAAFNRGPRRPAVVTMCHNVESHVFRQLRSAAREGLAAVPAASRLKAPLFRLWQTDLAIRLSNHVVCLSEIDRLYVLRRFRRTPHSVSVVPNGVRAEDYVPASSRGPGKRVLFVGGWIDVKGARALVRIWPTVLAAAPDASLTVAGAGVAVERVLASFPGDARSRITVTAVESADGMRRLYAEHDLLLMPSISEGSPLTLLEAAAAALPIVASRTGGIPDLVRDGTEALLYEPLRPDLASAHVIRLLRDPSLREQLSAAAQRRATEFTWLRTAEGLADACRRAIVARGADAAADVRQPA